MAHLLPSPRPHKWMSAVATVLPVAFAASATVVAAWFVFPTHPGPAVVLAALAWGAAAVPTAQRMAPAPAIVPATPAPPLVVDPETGVGTGHFLDEVLHREIARSGRYGSPLVLALFEFEVTGFRSGHASDVPPSPAKFVAQTLVNTARESDYVLRLEPRGFAVVLVECDGNGGESLVSRVLTRLGQTPYARNADGSGIYVRAAGAAVAWAPEFDTPEGFVNAALAALGEYGRALSVEHSWFSGGPVGPFDAGPGAPRTA